ncbi:MAG TPA: hypothetical protein VLS89_01275 [Candidatus Nanopelagicales bacterium]|nr:hypothetical protein [Candidatus Nanopelagicales bacterium]
MANPNQHDHDEQTSDLPVWSQTTLTPGEYADFIRLVTEEVGRQSMPAALDLQRGLLTLQQRGGALGQAPLQGLARLCRARGRAAWAETIREFFALLRRVHRDPARLLEPLERYEDARGRIKIRLHGGAYLAHPDAQRLVMRRVTDGIAGLLVCDLGFANVAVPAEMARSWRRSKDEVWAAAVENVRAEGRLHESLGMEAGVPVDLLASESHYAASHLLFFGDYVPRDAGYGALVGVPNRHMLVRHVIRGRDVFSAVHLMAQVIHDWYVEGPGQVAKDVYWWRAGKLTPIALTEMPNGLFMVVGDRFAEDVLDKVMQGN